MSKQKDFWDNEYSLHKEKWKKETKILMYKLKNKVVLELGVGNGKTLISLIKQKPKEIYALDFSKVAIENCKKDTRFQKVNLSVSDVKNMPYIDNFFDIIICHYILNNLLEKERIIAIKEIKRILKEKGSIYFEDFSYKDFRNNEGKEIEKNTKEKKNKIICHFFSIKELNDLFSKFRKSNFKEHYTFPLRNNKEIKRVIIRGNIQK